MSVRRQGTTLGTRHGHYPYAGRPPAAPTGAVAGMGTGIAMGAATSEYQPGTGNATPERMASVSRRKAVGGGGAQAQGEVQRNVSVKRGVTVHRSATQRKGGGVGGGGGGGGQEQKKGYEIVKQGIHQIHPAIDGPQAASSKPGDSSAPAGKSGEGVRTDKQTDLE